MKGVIDMFLSHGNRFVEKFQYYNIEYEKCSSIRDMPIYHFHEDYEIYYLISGERHYFINDRTYHIKSGDLVLINSNVIHRTTSPKTDGYERFLFSFHKQFLVNMSKSLKGLDLLKCFNGNSVVLRLDKPKQELIEQNFVRLMNECKNKKHFANREYMDLLAAELLINVNRCYFEQPEYNNDYLEYKYKKFFDIVTYINNNYMNDISLELVSKNFFLSVSTFTRTFKQATGFTFIEYLNSLRIKNAQNLLLNTDLSVSEISAKVGFNSQEHFSRVFKKLTGCSALKYRNTNSSFKAG